MAWDWRLRYNYAFDLHCLNLDVESNEPSALKVCWTQRIWWQQTQIVRIWTANSIHSHNARPVKSVITVETWACYRCQWPQGIRAFIINRFFQHGYQRVTTRNTNWKEMFAILHAFILWHKEWAQGLVDIASDNTTVVTAINKKSVRGPTIHPLRTILLICSNIRHWCESTFDPNRRKHYCRCHFETWLQEVVWRGIQRPSCITPQPSFTLTKDFDLTTIHKGLLPDSLTPRSFRLLTSKSMLRLSGPANLSIVPLHALFTLGRTIWELWTRDSPWKGAPLDRIRNLAIRDIRYAKKEMQKVSCTWVKGIVPKCLAFAVRA